jgi:hypothetical protein
MSPKSPSPQKNISSLKMSTFFTSPDKFYSE